MNEIEEKAARILSCDRSEIFYDLSREETIHWLGIRIFNETCEMIFSADETWLPLIAQAVSEYADTLSMQELRERKERFMDMVEAVQVLKDIYGWLGEKLLDAQTEKEKRQYLYAKEGHIMTWEKLGPLAKQFANQMRSAQDACKEFDDWLNHHWIFIHCSSSPDNRPLRCWIEERNSY